MTLLINANPLLRYDGYYILSDAMGIPKIRSQKGSLARSTTLKLDFDSTLACASLYLIFNLAQGGKWLFSRWLRTLHQPSGRPFHVAIVQPPKTLKFDCPVDGPTAREDPLANSLAWSSTNSKVRCGVKNSLSNSASPWVGTK